MNSIYGQRLSYRWRRCGWWYGWRWRRGSVCSGSFLTFLLLLFWTVLVIWIFFWVKLAQSFGFFDEWLLFDRWQWLPFWAQVLWDNRIMHIGCLLADFSPFNLAPHHKWIHRALYMARTMLFRLQKRKKNNARRKAKLIEIDSKSRDYWFRGGSGIDFVFMSWLACLWTMAR